MTRRLLAVTIGLVATVAFLIGLIVAGTMTPAPAHSAPEPRVVWQTVHEDLQKSARVRVVLDFLGEILRPIG